MKSEMKSIDISMLLQMRLLVGYLGERPQFAWWTTSFFGDYSLRSLEFVTPKTSLLAQYHGVVEAARKLHDEHLNVGSYHLFRLPEEVEQDLHAMMQSSVGGTELAKQAPQDKEAALATLKTLAGAIPSAAVGPTAVGNIDQLSAGETLKSIAGAYVSAFSQNAQTYPYLVS
ncbi:MAG TPA: BrxE family protein [Rhodocyclaceae bacterium]|nr:BrxE family protein [Rhodocyclaceae bacterium]